MRTACNPLRTSPQGLRRGGRIRAACLAKLRCQRSASRDPCLAARSTRLEQKFLHRIARLAASNANQRGLARPLALSRSIGEPEAERRCATVSLFPCSSIQRRKSDGKFSRKTATYGRGSYDHAEKNISALRLEQRRERLYAACIRHCRCFSFATADSCGYGAEPHRSGDIRAL